MNSEKLWTRNFVTASVINFLVFLIHLLLLVIIASYAVDKFHASTSIAGLVSSIFIIGVLIGRLGTGYIIEDKGTKGVLIFGTVLFIITSLLYFTAINLWLLIIIRLSHGIAYGVTSTATGTIVAKIIPVSRRGEGIGYYSMSAILALALGPFIGMFLIQKVNFNIIFITISVISVIIFAVSFLVDEPAYKSQRQDQAKAKTGFQLSNYLEFTAIPISTIALIIGFCYSIVLTFMSLYSKEIHLEEVASFYFLVYALTVLLSRPFSGRLLDAKGPSYVIYPSLLIFAIGMVLLSQAYYSFMLLLAGAVIGLGYGNFISCAQAISIKEAPSHRLGLATSTYFIFIDLGFGIGPYILGAMVPFTGYRSLYLIMSIVIIAAIILYYFLHRRKVKCKLNHSM